MRLYPQSLVIVLGQTVDPSMVHFERWFLAAGIIVRRVGAVRQEENGISLCPPLCTYLAPLCVMAFNLD